MSAQERLMQFILTPMPPERANSRVTRRRYARLCDEAAREMGITHHELSQRLDRMIGAMFKLGTEIGLKHLDQQYQKGEISRTQHQTALDELDEILKSL